MTCRLSINLNAIAYLRNRRNLPWPDLRKFARIALEAGADAITVHPRPDQRHIRFDDLPILMRILREEFPGREFNIEGYPSSQFLSLVEEVKPDQVTLVPDLEDQTTSDHGWDISNNEKILGRAIANLKSQGIRSSIFVDPVASRPREAKVLGADRIELFTGPFGGASNPGDIHRELLRILETGRAAAEANIDCNAGHDLTRQNLPQLISALPNLKEVSIGHAVIADALEFGLAHSVKAYRAVLLEGLQGQDH